MDISGLIAYLLQRVQHFWQLRNQKVFIIKLVAYIVKQHILSKADFRKSTLDLSYGYKWRNDDRYFIS